MAATHKRICRLLCLQGWLVGCLAVTAFNLPASAQEPAAEESAFITVGNPITDKVMVHVRNLTEKARQRYQESMKKEADGKKPLRRLVVVYDFNPDNQPSSSPLYGSCHDLAAYLSSLNDVVTVAFVHKDVSRHSVLPVLACKEIVMATGDSVHLGNVLPDEKDQLPRDAAAFYKNDWVAYYKKIAEARGRSPALVLKMLDRNLDVMAGDRPEGGKWWVDRRLLKESGLVNVRPEPVLPAGSLGFYSAAQAKEFGLCRGSLETRQQVAEEFQMPANSLREDPLDGRSPKAWRVVIDGTFNKLTEEKIKRRISRAVGQGANLLILELACGGGDPIVARDLGDFLRDLKDNSGQNPILTVAYVTPHARDYALFLALGCNEIVMQPHARLGDFERVLEAGPRRGQADPPSAEMLGKSLAGMAEKRDYPATLMHGMVERDLVIYEARNRKNPAVRRFMTDEEVRKDQDGERQWTTDGTARIKEKGDLLVLDAQRALDVGLSRRTVENDGQLYQSYGLDEAHVRTVGPDWFEEFAAFLRHSVVAVILVMLGITCLILELKLPGVGLPGVISALCFILFFWAHAQLAFTWLAVLLFLLGLVLIALEIFVMPGVAVLGVSGVVLLLSSLALATLERWPQTEGEWVSTATNLGRFGLALVGAVLTAIVAARYLPNIPYANRLVLVPPSERADALAAEAAATQPSPYSGLLGAIGVAATTLRPSGMVRFGDEFVDVVAEGSYIPPGTRVQVIEIEGNRIVVKEV